jgi:hypothetical protein
MKHSPFKPAPTKPPTKMPAQTLPVAPFVPTDPMPSAVPGADAGARSGDSGGEGVPASPAGGVGDNHGSGLEENCGLHGLDGFRHGEAALATALGLHPKALADARQKTAREGVDWRLVKNRVAYSEAGVRLVVTFLTGPIEDDLIAGVPVAALLERTLLEELVTSEPTVKGIVGSFYVNTQLIGVRLPDVAGVINVRVASTKNFARGMEVPLKKTAEGRYELARKLPRSYGKW